MLTSFALLGLVFAPSESGQDIILKEVARPVFYQLELRTSCADNRYVLSIEVQTGSTSRVVASTINGTNVEFQSPDGTLPLAISAFPVDGLVPTACETSTGALTISVRGYSSALGRIEGHNGDVDRSFSAHP